MKKLLIVLVLLLAGGAGAGQAAPAEAAAHGYLGVSIATVVERSPSGAERNGLVIAEVVAGSGAEAAGLRPHDRITTVAGAPVATMKDLQVALTGTRPGDVLTVEVVRDGKRESFRVTLGDQPAAGDRVRVSDRFVLRPDDAHAIAEGRHIIEVQESGPRLGVEVQPLRPQLAEYFGVKEGLLVIEVSEAGGAWEAGLRAGDVILEIDGTAVRRVGDIRHALADRRPGDTVDVTLQGRDGLQTLAVILSEPEKSGARVNVNLAPVGIDSESATIDISRLEFGEFTAEANVWLEAQPSREHLMAEIDRLEKRLQELHEQLREIQED